MTISVAGGNAISWNIVNKNVSAGVSLKQKLARKVAVLAKHLIHLPPETLHLQVVLEKLVKKERYAVSLTLRIPSNILHAEKSSHDLFEAIDSAVAALLCEVKSLKADLRGEYHWKRPAYRARLRADEALFFSEPMAAGPQTHADMVSELLRVHNNQLLAHVRREVRIAELAGDLPRGMVDPRDIVDEAARICLAHSDSKPVELTYELWFYQLIRRELARRRAEFNQEHSLSDNPPTGHEQAASEDEGYDAEQPLDLITRDPHRSPLALALREVLKKRLGYEPDVGVEEDHTWIRLADKRTFIAHHNQKVEIYVNDFDGKFEVPKPGSFRFHWTREIQRRHKRSKDITELLGSRK
jgi:ribosomal subunit interface protein